VNAATLSVTAINAGGNVSLSNAATLTVPAPTVTPKRVYGLQLAAGGSVSVDATSRIDLNGRGYPADSWSGPDFTQLLYGCHGGVRSNLGATDCTYGRFERARFAGSAGTQAGSGPARGGGFVELHASSLVLNGTITANGEKGYHTTGGGAGGGIHVDVGSVSGTGSFQVRGENYYGGGNENAGGGRISVYYATTNSFTGSYATGSNNNGASAGAGTAFVKQTSAAYGQLVVDNNSHVASAGSTPFRRVGRLLITGVYRVSSSQWRIEVGGSPWKPTDAMFDWGVDGLDVDLDAGETASPLYRIASNTANTLTINTTDDLSTVVGQYLVGVQTFETVRVTGGADVDFGEDRLVINNLGGSTIGATSTLRVGEVNQATLQIGGGGALQLRNNPALSNLTLNGLGSSTLVFDDPVNVNALTIGSGNVVFNGAVTVGSGLDVAGGATVAFNGTLNINGTLSVSGASTMTVLGETDFPADVLVSGSSTLIATTLFVDGNLTLTSTSKVSVPVATVSPKRVYGLQLVAGGSVSIDATSRIDVNGRGYPADSWSGPDFTQTLYGCHGGIRSNLGSTNCTYGRLERARFAGSAGTQSGSGPARGGGFVELHASSLVLNGTITANGEKGYHTTGGGAGGGIHVEVGSLSGAGNFQVRGENYYGGGNENAGGGRISVYYDTANSFTGSYAMGSNNNGASSGAGTAFVKRTSAPYGQLVVDNNAHVAAASSTPIRSVGRQLITGVYRVSASQWRIEVGGSPWKASDPALDWGIDGLEVDLDATETASALYRIVSNTANTITINTSDNLAGAVGSTLVGVQTFETVRVTGGADVDLGEDRLVISNLGGSAIGATSTLRVGEVNQATLQIGGGGTLQVRNNPALSNLTLNGLGTSTLVFDDPVNVNALTIGSGNVVFNGGLTVPGNLPVSGSTAQVTVNGRLMVSGDLLLSSGASVIVNGEIQGATNAIVNAATLVSDDLALSGNLQLLGGGVLSVPPATVTPKRVYGMQLVVDGTVTIDATSRIDVNGRGYPADSWSGPDFMQTLYGCHAGIRSNLGSTDCTYGRYERARFAGSAGTQAGSCPARGGGFAEIHASSLVLNGTITANGEKGYHTTGGGAGGGIHVEVGTLSGTGSFQVRGENYYGGGNQNAGGGRISVYYDTANTFTGSYATGSNNNGASAGSGTAFVKQTSAPYGQLIVDNNNHVAAAGSTPLRRVGRQLITGVFRVTQNQWRLEVAGEPWKASDAVLDWGIDGLEVDLDASETASPLYRVVSNTANTVTINTSDNLAGVVGQELIGVHTFDRLTVTRGASVDFGGDRVIVLNQ
jgi:hypothetical protein